MPNIDTSLLPVLLAALGLGLLIGAVRERQHKDPMAGVRTHALVALLGAIGLYIGVWALALVLLLLVGLVWISYWRQSQKDAGMTGEIALLLTCLLGALCLTQPALATASGVVVAVLLYAKASLHRFTKEILSEAEVHDGLILLGSALVILPLLPDTAMGPNGVLNPTTIWRLVVLIMLISTVGHISLRVIGNRWGLALAGFFSGYVSSTAAIAGFGERVREQNELLRSCVAAAMFANLASLSLFVPILLAVSPRLLQSLWLELAIGGSILLIGGLLGLRSSKNENKAVPNMQTRMFRIGHALLLAAMISAVILISAWLTQQFGSNIALLASMFAAIAEVHASAASLGQLVKSEAINLQVAHWGFFGIIAVSAVTKMVIAWASGGKAYGLRVSIGLASMLAGILLVVIASDWLGW
ncbi:MAG: MgtC/SapB family protein [Methylococcales bacterium]